MNPQWADHAYDAASNSIKPVPGKTGLTIDEFSKIRIPEEVLRDGIIFIWVQKELIFSVIKVLESQNFEYVENLCHVMLDPKYFEATKRIGNTDATPAIYREPYRFLNKSHRTLLMLRRNIRRQDEQPLELRHQRTGDVVFDWVDESQPHKTPEYYTYKLIETLLPKSRFKGASKGITSENYEEARDFRLVELWAQNDSKRSGWLKVSSQA